MSAFGLVVARHRRHVVVEDSGGRGHVCLMRGRKIMALVGDRVLWRKDDGACIVTGVSERRSTLSRIDARGRREDVAANVEQLLVVVAAEPKTETLLLDRYLAGAELSQLHAVVVFNKMDLLPQAPDFLRIYASIGYAVHCISTREGPGLNAVAAEMRGRLSAMVGQSGVGKSSLLNALLGTPAQAVGALSEKSGRGRHTTTAAQLYRLPGGGRLIDSPGVRSYAPFIEQVADVQLGFREFRPRLGRCRFDDCLHLAEPDCAVKAAVAAGEVDAGRYDSYTKMCAQVRSLRA